MLSLGGPSSRPITQASHRTLYGDFFVKWKSGWLSLFGMGRGVRARPAPGRRSLGGANCRWAQPLSRPQPPEAVAEGQPLQGLGPSTTIGGRVYASLRLGLSPDLARGREGWREAERV